MALGGQLRPDYVNSDLSDLDRSLVPPAPTNPKDINTDDYSPQHTRKNKPTNHTQIERRLDSMEKGLIKIQVK